MTERTVRVINKAGIHARPSALIVKTASQYQSDVFLTCDGTEVNAKSIMSVMMLAAAEGCDVTIQADGPDEEEVIQAITDLFEKKFFEE